MKSWKEKLYGSKDLPRIVEVPEKMRKRLGEGKMVIPSPLEVKEIMDSVPEKRVVTINVIRKVLAEKHNVETACPITTGIFAWIVANAAEEMKEATPYWRTLKGRGELNEKYPGGVERQKEMLEKEGHKIVKKGKKFVVENYEEYLYSP
ncbi:MAG: MGMT family protein [Thermoplasmata archaeon]|jgi:alkylated DNA nucleotide flippase Atl1|nr:MGMT family protein [Thermoplasmata archaeon]